MKIRVLLANLLVVSSLFFFSCGSTSVKRYEANESVKDLSGYWNDNDVNLVCTTLIDSCIKSKRVANFKSSIGRTPVVIIGTIKNKSVEHIDTSILSKRFQNVIINDGTLEFVADASQREQLRAEKFDQAENAYETAKSMGNEIAADFMLQGSVTTIVDTDGRQQVRTYQVDMQLIDLETNKIIWSDQNNDIKKYIKKSAVKF
ncbi:penicillin-binding protein activator LpoB [Treponema berlinense]|uniref:penicillin-binding protein activator LpoB n=1 Tax=Treponema berlinense TaxID=225004 RepID=UPI0026ECF9D2|nr:penicillin-binding protein activator LpoB [Treponema berlinense]